MRKGKIITSKDGLTRVEIYPNESKDPKCFTAMNLADGDLSSLWLKDKFNFK